MVRGLPLVVVALAASGAIRAQQVFTVTSTADDPAAAAIPGTLRWAIAQAEADAAVDTVRFSPTLADSTITLYQDPSVTPNVEELTITEGLYVDGAAAPGVTISGGWDGLRATFTGGDQNDPADYTGNVGTRIFHLPIGSTPAVTIRNLELTLGNAGPSRGGSTSGIPNDNGGAIYMEGGTLSLVDVTISACTANDGAAILIEGGAASIDGCTFFDNRARDDGGAFDLKGGTSVTAINSTFYANVAGAGGFDGGTGSTGSLARAGGTFKLDHCTIAYNQANEDVIDGRGGKVDVSRNLFIGNVDDVGTLSVIDVDASADLRDFGGGTLGTDDGNYGDLTQAGFNAVTAEDAALGPLADNGGPTSTCALGCLTTLRGVLAAAAYPVDQRDSTRSGATEPGAYELQGCPDTDGDSLLDFAAAEDDDDADGITDADEYQQAPLDTTDLGALGASTPLPSSTDLAAGGSTVTFAFAADESSAGVATSAAADAFVVTYDNARADQRPTVDLDFGAPVYELTFALSGFDIDGADGTEEVTVTLAYDGPEGTLTQVLTASDLVLAGDVEQDGNRLRATGSTTTGSATLTAYPLPVNRVTFTFGVGPISGDPEAMELSLSEVSFRAPAALDPDGDGTPAPVDIDADGDGIVDRAEAQTEEDYGVAVGMTPPPGQTATNLTPVDTDNDGVPDFLDLDSDDDGEFDDVEGHDSVVTDGVPDGGSPANSGVPNGLDADGDGLDDGYDNAIGASGTDNASNFAGPGTYPNSDNVGDVGDEGNWRDDDANVAGYIFADADGDGVREAGETGVAGGVARLFSDAGTELASATVDATGRFLFADVKDPGAVGEGVTDFYLVFEGVNGQAGIVPNDVGGNTAASDRVDSDYTDQGGILRTIGTFTVGEAAPAAFFGAGFSETALPVTFLAVSAEPTADCRAEVAWAVADERDVSHYRVERLAGDGTWTPEVEVAATGASVYAATASATDAYYRVVSVDLDGATGRSDAVAVAGCTANGLPATAFPNPATAGATIALSWGEAPTRPVTVHDASGRTVRSLAAVGANRLPTTGLPAGVYVARSGAEALRFVIR